MSQSVRAPVEDIRDILLDSQTTEDGYDYNSATKKLCALFSDLLSELEMEEEQQPTHADAHDIGFYRGWNTAVHEFNTKLQRLKAQLQEET